MVDEYAVGQIAYLTLHNGIGAHGLLIKRTLYLAKTASLSLCRTATMLLETSLIVSRLLDEVFCRTVPTDDCA